MERPNMPRPRSLFNRREPRSTSAVPPSPSPNAIPDNGDGLADSSFTRVRSERETMMGDADALRRIHTSAARARGAAAAGRSRMPRSISAQAKMKRSFSSFRRPKGGDNESARAGDSTDPVAGAGAGTGAGAGAGARMHRSTSAHPSIQRPVPSFRQTKDTTTTTSSSTTTNSTDKKSKEKESEKESTRDTLGRFARSAKHVVGRAVAVPAFVLLDVLGSVAGRR